MHGCIKIPYGAFGDFNNKIGKKRCKECCKREKPARGYLIKIL